VIRHSPVVFGAQKYTSIPQQRTHVTNQSVRRQTLSRKADYPICGLRGVLKFRRSNASLHRALVIEASILSGGRCPSRNWLREMELAKFKRRSLRRAQYFNSMPWWSAVGWVSSI
jgi:hypothetical protein